MMDIGIEHKRPFKNLINYLLNLIKHCLYHFFIHQPIFLLKSLSRHPFSILFLFSFLFPVYLITQYFISFIKYITPLFKQHQYQHTQHSLIDQDDEFFQYLERCSICFESRLDLCLDYCKDQFCLDCFQKYVTQVVQSSWGLSVTKIKCPVCKITISSNEWTKYVPKKIEELYYKYNQPYRTFSKCCPRCEDDITPCDEYIFEKGVSKKVATMLKEFFLPIQDILKDKQSNDFIQLFDRVEWRNSSLPTIHKDLIAFLIQTCQFLNQTPKIKLISKQIMQLEMRPDTWKKLQFNHISFFSNITCPTCEISFCLQCGEDIHPNQSCENNMKQLILQNKQTSEWVENLKWKINYSRRCPSCSIFIHRDEGCNKVDCSLCGHTFCWECGSDWVNGCTYFACINKNAKESLELLDEAMIFSSNKAEIGVPNMDIIHSRLNIK